MADASDAVSFEFYEGIRVAVPGAVVVLLFSAVAATFGLPSPQPGDSTLAAALIAVLAGFVLYFLDAPAKAAIYRHQLPTDALLERGKPKTGSLVNLYFILLEEALPAPLRARALYMGSIFRIGFESIYLLTGTAGAVLTVADFRAMGKAHAMAEQPHRAQLVIVGCLLFAVMPATAWLEDRRRRQQDHDNARTQGRQPTRYEDLSVRSQIGWLGFGSFVVSAVCELVCWCGPASCQRWTAAAAVAVSFAPFIVRYFVGWMHDGKARPLERVPATVLLTVPCCLLAANTAKVLPGHSTVPADAAAGWLLALFVALILVASRGHEKRLQGSYASQRTWFKLYPEKLAGYFVEENGE